jgi:hypothetical protein
MSALDENPDCARAYASFRISLAALSGDEVTAALGISPTTVSDMAWGLSSRHAVSSTSLERHLSHLLDAIEPVAPALEDLRARSSAEAGFFCYWLSARGHGGPELSSSALARIARLDAPLAIDFYGPLVTGDDIFRELEGAA